MLRNRKFLHQFKPQRIVWGGEFQQERKTAREPANFRECRVKVISYEVYNLHGAPLGALIFVSE